MWMHSSGWLATTAEHYVQFLCATVPMVSLCWEWHDWPVVRQQDVALLVTCVKPDGWDVSTPTKPS